MDEEDPGPLGPGPLGPGLPGPEELPPAPRERAVEAVGLQVRDLTVRFGGLTAVNGVTFDAPMNRITGLIGPNGAGKTTTFDACSGLNRRFTGQVLLHGTDVSRASAAVHSACGAAVPPGSCGAVVPPGSCGAAVLSGRPGAGPPGGVVTTGGSGRVA